MKFSKTNTPTDLFSLNAEFTDTALPEVPIVPKPPQSYPIDTPARPFGSFGSFGTKENKKAESEENPQFPVHALPETVRMMIEETSRVTQTPYALPALSALGTIAAALGRGLLVKSGGSRITPPNLFLIAVAGSGVGKSSTHRMLTRPLEDAESEAQEHWNTFERPRIEAELKIAMRRAAEKEKQAAKEDDSAARYVLTQELQDIEREQRQLEEERDSSPKFIVGDITEEKLALLLARQPGEALASMSSEARGLVDIILGRYGNGKSSDEGSYAAFYSGDRVTVDRIGRPSVILENPCLTLTWLLQPDVARKISESITLTASGFFPRAMVWQTYAMPEDEPEELPEMIPAVANAWHSLIQSLLKFRDGGDNPAIIEATRDAREALRGYANECRRIMRAGTLQDVESYVARWAENAWRLAIGVHAAKHGAEADKHELDLRSAEQAIEVMRWAVDRQLEFLEASRMTNAEARLNKLQGILAGAKGEETLRNLKRRGFEKSEVESLATRFSNQIELVKLQTGGRPSVVARLKPLQKLP